MGFWALDLVSQMRTLASKEPEMSTESSVPPKQTVLMRELWPLGPLNRWMVLAVVTSQRNTLLSPPTVAKRALSLFNDDLVSD
jgi:hypothetical protein